MIFLHDLQKKLVYLAQTCVDMFLRSTPHL